MAAMEFVLPSFKRGLAHVLDAVRQVKHKKINLAIACLLALFCTDTKQKYFCDLSPCVPTKNPQVYQDMISCVVISKEQSAKLAAKHQVSKMSGDKWY